MEPFVEGVDRGAWAAAGLLFEARKGDALIWHANLSLMADTAARP